ncbi:NUDIX domain-containing protein [Sporosarcina pasteurii]|uniref:8-oxo-dGTP diphosphatase YtkD n=1 Tax=Sporosarcina pasteurii TaxID=1474 RepID=A0A380C9V0_SPOPA|nr:NUDIX domain-containing protein [Sporosarcina pasteurii]MDS9472960.1 NUDIX domain-containing protein [Sporosarcina pasteurii]QBQ04476.1 NUDIX domain-containing protein [Sporosarcina pasteurii]SUJ14597.1 Putative 8-oxo-dGTP diphosphatase YtkD [Sporosarcina pasteurii]
MLVFHDSQGGHVELSFGKNCFEVPARHVLVVLKHGEKWLLTKHRTRGIEFPGGKAELGESLEAAAIRETFEETGVTISNVHQFAEYLVRSNITFCKAVFTGVINEIEENPTLHETEGAIWMTDEELDACKTLSFHMKDTGMTELRRWVETNER